MVFQAGRNSSSNATFMELKPFKQTGGVKGRAVLRGLIIKMHNIVVKVDDWVDNGDGESGRSGYSNLENQKLIWEQRES
ncbi:hypothetical protein TIFTF001_013777 [Ficus carica]|uniref:Uncharacterized protein n=1 Tax=Ficus carica TaxID=3494 RepID=A0AA88A1J7_FICCA|nr:hypothetical protein TIFTF001_013777 [Ficus carica]